MRHKTMQKILIDAQTSPSRLDNEKKTTHLKLDLYILKSQSPFLLPLFIQNKHLQNSKRHQSFYTPPYSSFFNYISTRFSISHPSASLIKPLSAITTTMPAARKLHFVSNITKRLWYKISTNNLSILDEFYKKKVWDNSAMYGIDDNWLWRNKDRDRWDIQTIEQKKPTHNFAFFFLLFFSSSLLSSFHFRSLSHQGPLPKHLPLCFHTACPPSITSVGGTIFCLFIKN